MLKRWFLVGVMLLLVSLLVVGCGIPQEEHDAVIAERDAAQAEVASLQSELAGVQSDLAATETDLATSESDLATAQSRISSLQSDFTAAQAKVSELEDFKTELGSLWDSLEPKLTLAGAILNFWNGAAQVLAGEKTELEYEVQTTKFLDIATVQTEVIGNDELIELWDDVVSYSQQEKETEFFSSFAALTDLLMDLIDPDIVAIEAKLSE